MYHITTPMCNATFTLGVFCDRHADCMYAAYAGQSDVDAGQSDVCSMHAGCTSIVKYALNEHVHPQRILPSSFSIYIHRPLASTNQTVSSYTYL